MSSSSDDSNSTTPVGAPDPAATASTPAVASPLAHPGGYILSTGGGGAPAAFSILGLGGYPNSTPSNASGCGPGGHGSTSAASASSPVFTAKDNDIIVRASDDTALKYRALYLQAASKALESAVAAARETAGKQRPIAGMPVVRLEADGPTVQKLLLFLHPAAANPWIQYEDLEKLCKLDDKYGLRSVVAAAVAQSGAFIVCSQAASSCVGLALVYQLSIMASYALRLLDEGEEEWPDVCMLPLVPWRFLKRVPFMLFVRLHRQRTADGSWASVISSIETCAHFWEAETAEYVGQKLDSAVTLARIDRLGLQTDESISAGPPIRSPSRVFQDDSNDIILKASDGREFGFRKIYLEAASAKFDKMLADAPKKTKDGKDVLEIDAGGGLLETLLLYLHPSADPPKITSYKRLEAIVMFADQLGTSGVITSVMGQSSTWFLRQHAPEVLALAVEHKMPTIVAAALRAFDDPAVKLRGCDDALEPSAARFRLNDIPLRLLKRLDFAVLVRLLRRESILLTDYHCHDNYSTLAERILRTPDFFTNAEQALVDDDKKAAQAVKDIIAAPKNEPAPSSGPHNVDASLVAGLSSLFFGPPPASH